MNEPQGSPTWFPANDTPKDFATYDFAITVPEGRTALANGDVVSQTDNGDTTTWRWREDRADGHLPGDRHERRLRAARGHDRAAYPSTTPLIPRRAPRRKEPDPASRGAAWRSSPRRSTSSPACTGRTRSRAWAAIVDWAPNVFYSLESQTKPNYWRVPDETIVHELAHQWFGDALVLERWPDMWLNEGFATWSEWIWTERHNGKSAQQQFDELYATARGLGARPGPLVPGPERAARRSRAFHTPVYDRGAMTLQALREKVGDDEFLEIVRSWYAENRHSNVTTADFIALAERRGASARQLVQPGCSRRAGPIPGGCRARPGQPRTSPPPRGSCACRQGRAAGYPENHMETGTFRVKAGLAEMLKGGVIMDVITPEHAKIAEEAGAAAVMALERVPADIRRDGGVARMSDPTMIEGIKEAVSIPVMAKARIGHFVEAQVLEALDVDYIDESEVLTPADEAHHIDK